MKLLLALLFALPSPASAQEQDLGLSVESVRRIWDDGNYNAFTDILRHGELFLCSFREGERHVYGRDGAARVIASKDGVQWESVARLTVLGVDLRDPKLSVMPDGRVMMVMGGSRYEGKELVGKQPHVAFSKDGVHWSEPQPVLDEGDWLWRVTWHGSVGYGVVYRPGEAAGLELVATRDGHSYERVVELDVPGKPNETTLRFAADGEMWAFIRREGADSEAMIGRSSAPYTEWTFKKSGHRVGGPNFIADPRGGWIGAGRAYEGGTRTVLGRLDAQSYTPSLELPSGGDTSYPGMVWFEGKLLVSYYSSHEAGTGVYLAVLGR